MSDARRRSPRRFRRRLTAAFVLVAALSAGLVATVTVVLARESRWHGFRATSLDEARFALAVAPATLDGSSFERFRSVYHQRSDAHILVIDGDEVFVSSADLDASDVPTALEDVGNEPVLVRADVDGRSMLVAGAVARDGSRYFLFFSLDQLNQSFHELVRAAVLSWFVTVVLAGAVGSVVARRTLRPVADAARASEAIADGDLAARLPAGATDEFGILATSFNHMADEVQTLVDRLADAARRERRFTADVAHELRTPLTGMAASASLLRDQIESLPMSSRRPAAILVHDVQRLRDLVLELLELDHLEAPTGPPLVEPLDVRAAITAVLADMPALDGATIEVDVAPGLSALADPFAFRRVLVNLVENAVLHGGGTPIRVVGQRCGADVCIDVIDAGDGISPDDIERVFDRFYKSDRSRSTGGSGLGLAIAQQYAQSQGGSLSVWSETTGGARFTLRLRNAQPDTEVAAPMSTDGANTTRPAASSPPDRQPQW